MVVLQFSLLATIMSVHHSPLGVNVRCHLICLFFWLPMFLLLWEITNLPLTSLLSMVLEHPPSLTWWYRWGAVDHLSSRLISDHPHHHLVPGAFQSECVRDTQTKEDPPSCPRLLLHPTSSFWALFLQKGHIVYLFVCVYHSLSLYSLRLVRLECLECTFCTGATSLNDGCFRFEWLAILECCNTSRRVGFLQRHLLELRKHQQHIFASSNITADVLGKSRCHLDTLTYILFCLRFWRMMSLRW